MHEKVHTVGDDIYGEMYKYLCFGEMYKYICFVVTPSFA